MSFSSERLSEFRQLVSWLVSQGAGHCQPYVNLRITLVLGLDIRVLPDQRSLVFSDNGIGLNETDIEEFVSVLGASNKGPESLRDGSLSGKLIGRFGIGLFSSFVVGDRVTLRTKKLSGSKGYEWVNEGSSQCTLKECDRPYVGTEVTVRLREGAEFAIYLDPAHLGKAAAKYMDFLPVPIYLDGEGPLNSLNAPWHIKAWESAAAKDSAYRDFVNDRYPDFPIEVIPIEIDSPVKASGVLYISDRATPDITSAGLMDVYVQRVFVIGKDPSFLPRWARFVSGVIDSPDLEPNAARDNVLRRESAYEYLHNRLGELVIEHLRFLARQRPARFEQINKLHHYHLMGMALVDEAFFREVADLLLFTTNRGMMSLKEYLPKNPPANNKAGIYYCAAAGSSTLLFTLAEKKGLTVIDAGGGFEERFILRYAETRKDSIVLFCLDAAGQEILFDPIEDPDQRAQFDQLEATIEGMLRQTRTKVRARRFKPENIPAVLVSSPRNRAQKEFEDYRDRMALIHGFEASIKELTDEDSANYVQPEALLLYLNAENDLVKRLAGLSARTSTTDEVMLGIYNSSFLGSPNLVTRSNANIIYLQMQRLFQTILDSAAEIGSLRDEVEQLRLNVIATAPAGGAPSASDGVIDMFMITPFADKYKNLEGAARQVFEMDPFFFRH